MGRLLAIDYGKKRSGLAVTDPAQIVPGGLTTVNTKDLMDFLKAYTAKEPVERIVIGWPTRLDGTPSENQKRVADFSKKLQQQFPDLPVERCDERFTSTIAHRVMLDAGLKKKARQNKALVDEISATLILQTYMDSRSALPPMPPMPK